MNILDILLGNLRRGALTLRFPARVEPPAYFRGLVQLEAERCIGCATCAYACASRALRVTSNATGYEWTYDPGQCTFCARCADVCPMHALTLQAERPPLYRQAHALSTSVRLSYPLCPECGQPAQPIDDMILARVFEVRTDEVRAWSRLCAQCRQRRYQPALIENTIPARRLANGR